MQPQICRVNEEKLVVLVVDDSALIMDKMIGILGDIENIRIVFQANDHAEAITIVEEAEPDIILMDIFLQGHICFDLLKFLRSNYPALRTVVFTNHAGQHYRDRCQRMGAHHFFDKSKDFDRIQEIINHN